MGESQKCEILVEKFEYRKIMERWHLQIRIKNKSGNCSILQSYKIGKHFNMAISSAPDFLQYFGYTYLTNSLFT